MLTMILDRTTVFEPWQEPSQHRPCLLRVLIPTARASRLLRTIPPRRKFSIEDIQISAAL